MSEGYIDLHIHSNKSSDGDFSPSQICHLAKEKNLKAISIADHDTLDAYPEAIFASQKEGLEVIPNIELTTSFQTREFHLLLPFINWTKKEIYEILEKVNQKKEDEAKKRVGALQQLGFDITWEEVKKSTKSHPPLGVVIAKVLLDKEEKKKNSLLRKYFEGENRFFAPYKFYQDYFTKNKPAYFPKEQIDIRQAIKTGKQFQGVPVLAHPGAYFQRADENDILQLKKEGLEGLEVYTSYHTPEQVKFYLALARKLDLVPTAGSDFHGGIKPHITLGALKDGEYWMIEELKKRGR
ncbi:MAG: PHP domain-containing protein [Candidatus Aminicenantia bacterium]